MCGNFHRHILSRSLTRLTAVNSAKQVWWRDASRESSGYNNKIRLQTRLHKRTPVCHSLLCTYFSVPVSNLTLTSTQMSRHQRAVLEIGTYFSSPTLTLITCLLRAHDTYGQCKRWFSQNLVCNSQNRPIFDFTYNSTHTMTNYQDETKFGVALRSGFRGDRTIQQ